MIPFTAKLRRLMWLYAMGAIALGPLKSLLAGIVLQAILTARVEALSRSVATYEVLLPSDLYPLPDWVEQSATNMVGTIVEALPRPEALTDEELELVGDGLVETAESWTDEELSAEEEWMKKLSADYDRSLAEELAELEAKRGLRDAQEAARQEAEEAELEARDIASQIPQEEELEDLDLDEDDYLPDEIDEEDLDLDDETHLMDEIEEAGDKIDRLTSERVQEEVQAAQAEALETILEEGSPVLPEKEPVAVVWETDADPCPECLALAGTPVKRGKKGRARGHHPNCKCSPDIQLMPPNKHVPGFMGLTVEQLEHQLTVMEPLKPSAWKTQQTARVRARINEMRTHNA